MNYYDRIKKLNDLGYLNDGDANRLNDYVALLEENNIPVIYNLRHIRKIFQIAKKDTNLYFGNDRAKLYHFFCIPKKSGGMREIEAPSPKLKAIQRWILDEILFKFEPAESAKGFRKGLSIVDNAKLHVGKELIINFDLENFFPSIKYSDVYRLFYYIGYSQAVAHCLALLCTNSKNVLPQGSPASPAISNLIVYKLDARLSGLAKSYGATYSRYADDITISGSKSIKSLIPIVEKIVLEEGYHLNHQKTRCQYSFQRQEVTGLIVNKKLSVSKALENELKNAIYFCDKYNIDDHMKHINCHKAFYIEHLYGIAYFIHMVDREKGQRYLSKLDNINWD